ncbi:DUF4214 domain-containing protein [Paraburkholderia fungorum]|uniref:beta strand repeat-containing protein n=1 Tax=Paraburkholderia fungorum TaxID=134537 RepID=UPI0038BB0D9F
MAAAQYYDEVQQAYLAYYGRPADPAGLAYWATQLNNAGGNLNSIINAFGTSAESTALYGGSNTAAQITAIYQTLFGRTPDAAGLNFYVNGIATGQFTLASVALNIYYGAQGADATALAAKLTYADAFTNALEASPSAQVAYAGTAASTNARAAVATVVDTTSEAAAAANVSTTVANISTGTVGQTVTLTSGVDAITLTGNNNVVNGIVGNTATGSAQAVSTFTPLDSITAASGSTGNVLNLAVTTAAAALGSDIPAGVKVSGVQTVNLTDAGATGVDNVTSWTGLTQLNVTEVGGAQGITAAGTTNVTLTDTANAALSNINVNGGQNVSVTANAVVAAGTINVGTTTATPTVATVAPTGTVTVTENVLASGSTSLAADAINVVGGTTVTVTANLAETGAATLPVVTGGAISVTGTAATTSVTVNQTASVKATPAVVATAGSPAVTAVPAAPGVTAVAGSAATSLAAAKAAVAGVVDGAVTVQDASYNTTTANTITSVSLNNYGIGSAINDNALANLSLSGTAGTLAITNATAAGVTPTANSTLSLTLNGLKVGVDATGTALAGGNAITDTNGEIKTLNVTTATANSTLTAFADTGLTTLNVSGTNVLTLGTINGSLTALNVSGAAGFNDSGAGAGTGLAARAGALTITDTSSGKFTATLDATTQTFVGSTGQDVITISAAADATKAITAGSATNNELVLNGAYALTSATAKLVTGFQTIGANGLTSGTAIDMSVLDKTASALDIMNNAATLSFTKVAQGASVTFDATTTASVNVNYADASGSTDTTAVTIGAATNAAGITVFGLGLADANGNGIGTVNVVSNDVAYGTTNLGNTISTLQDSGLATLNVSGSGALTITALNETLANTQAAAATPSSTFTLNNTDTGVGGVTIGTFTDTGLGALSFTGTGNTTIGVLNNANSTVLNVSDSDTGVVTIGTLNSGLTSLTLNGNVALGGLAPTVVGSVSTPITTDGLQDSFANGVTISGATDNAHVTANLTVGAAATFTDSITLGNGNNYVLDASTAGTVNVTVGTGSNLIDLSKGAASTYSASVTLGAHSAATGVDSISVGTVVASAVTPNTVITGAVKGDIITINDATAATTITQATTVQQTAITAAGSLSAAINIADNGLAAQKAVAFQFGGNTYVIESHAAGTGTLAAGDTFIELMGAHTVGAAGSAVTLTGHQFSLVS